MNKFLDTIKQNISNPFYLPCAPIGPTYLRALPMLFQINTRKDIFEFAASNPVSDRYEKETVPFLEICINFQKIIYVPIGTFLLSLTHLSYIFQDGVHVLAMVTQLKMDDPTYETFYTSLNNLVLTCIVPKKMVPSVLGLEFRPNVLKEHGNTAHRKRDFGQAIKCYTAAILFCYLTIRPLDDTR